MGEIACIRHVVFHSEKIVAIGDTICSVAHDENSRRQVVPEHAARPVNRIKFFLEIFSTKPPKILSLLKNTSRGGDFLIFISCISNSSNFFCCPRFLYFIMAKVNHSKKLAEGMWKLSSLKGPTHMID